MTYLVENTKTGAFHRCASEGQAMNRDEFSERAARILHNMALERKGWRGIFSRWHIPAEPLRNDAANLLRDYGILLPTPMDCQMVGDRNE